jgi:hypothetical protein
MQKSNCPNTNHDHKNAPVRFCPMCSVVVNINIPAKKCVEGEHVLKRQGRNKYCTYCVDCGEQLIPSK